MKTIKILILFISLLFTSTLYAQSKSLIKIINNQVMIIGRMPFAELYNHLKLGECSYYYVLRDTGVKFIIVSKENTILFFNNGDTFTFATKSEQINTLLTINY